MSSLPAHSLYLGESARASQLRCASALHNQQKPRLIDDWLIDGGRETPRGREEGLYIEKNNKVLLTSLVCVSS